MSSLCKNGTHVILTDEEVLLQQKKIELLQQFHYFSAKLTVSEYEYLIHGVEQRLPHKGFVSGEEALKAWQYAINDTLAKIKI